MGRVGEGSEKNLRVGMDSTKGGGGSWAFYVQSLPGGSRGRREASTGVFLVYCKSVHSLCT